MGSKTETEFHVPEREPGETTEQTATEIYGYDSMEPFLMTLVSDSDLWMYVSSLGSLTAGRIDEDHSLFPYCVEDIVHRSAGRTGPTTVLRVWQKGDTFEIWEPFASPANSDGLIRKLSKTVLGNRIAFEETHERLGLTFRYEWTPSDRFGFVRTAEIVNNRHRPVRVDVVDGLLNLIPAGITYQFTQRMSVLVDAYTECEVDPITGVTTVSLASLIVDKPEPGEALFASAVWSRGLEGSTILLSQDQLTAFRQGNPVTSEVSLKGRRGNYLISASLNLEPGDLRTWDIVADTGLSQAQVEALRAFLIDEPQPRHVLRQSIEASAENLARYVSAADGQPCSADSQTDRHQQACVLFNIMRGGIYASGDEVSSSDFADFVATRNRKQARKHRKWLTKLPRSLVYGDLVTGASKQNDRDLLRLAYEYLPLTFSRRHGDPSRPWNRFAIRVKNPDGSPLLAYEGNWRDIFQNWEALSLSYPMFIESVIAKFVNASTVDGYNPYRITREGIDWEVPNPEDAWSSMGYWGDHQIIYLLKFLEQAKQVRPKTLTSLLNENLFSYANVPLRLRPFDAVVRDPQSTMDFDHEMNKRIEAQIQKVGTDARLLHGSDGEVYHVTLVEKLLVPALSKLSNLVLDAGIWMNTQRPEWNDANNALVGNGVSMVTLCYLRRYLTFCKDLFEERGGRIDISFEVAQWLTGIVGALEAHRAVLANAKISDEDRRTLLNELGWEFSSYRGRVYQLGFSGQASMSIEMAIRLCDAAIPYLDHSIRASLREDGLYHAYNLVDLRDPARASVSPLYEMLEGQVAVLSAGVLSPSEVGDLIQALFASKMLQRDHGTFLLYPDRRLPGFLEKNIIPDSMVRENPLLAYLIESGDTRVVVSDVASHYRFAPSLRNASALTQVMDQLEKEPEWAELVDRHRTATLDAYEAVFGHRFFTGRSGAMYAYEGLGSIYWHMVSKLLVAVQESFFLAERAGASRDELRRLASGYYRIRSGMGFNKTAREFGAFPSDPYSHTPAGRGAKQPGMTGQSKEDILSRWMEFGVFSSAGSLEFRPSMLRRSEFLPEPRTWHVRGLDGKVEALDLPKNSLGFTVCAVPVIYQLGAASPQTAVLLCDGAVETHQGAGLTEFLSREVYARSGKVKQITVSLTENEILGTSD